MTRMSFYYPPHIRKFALTVLALGLIVGVLASSSNTPNASADGAWYNSDWSYRKTITIDHTKVSGSGNFTNFPVLINRTDADWKSVGNEGNVWQADGGDILFTASDGMTKLDHEVEKYDPATGELVAWVEVPTLDFDDDTEIYIYYGNPTGVANQENPTEVYSSNNFQAVWHMSEDPSGSAPQMNDSTGNGNNATSQGSMTSDDLASGKIGDSLDFDGSNDYLTQSQTAPSSAGTFSAWVQWDTVNNTEQTLLVDEGAGYTVLSLNKGSGDSNKVVFSTYNGAADWISSTTTISAGTWYHVAATYNGTTDELYVNGALESSNPSLGPGGNAMSLAIGKWGAAFLNGRIDELRVVGSVRSPDWIATEYNNQNNPSTFYDVSLEENQSYNITITESGGTTNVVEGGATDSYTVVLVDEPSDDVVITVSSQDTSTGVTVNPAILTFTTANWDTPQTVTVTAVDDSEENEGPDTTTITHVVTSDDNNYDGLSVSSVTANVTDNDDTQAPIISSIFSSNNGTSATITWTTDEASSSQVEYGFTDSYGMTTTEADISPRVTSHSVEITGLSQCRTYHFRVKSTDAQSYQATSSDRNLFTTGCEIVYPGINSTCDDTNPNDSIRIRTDSDVTTVRNNVIADIWSGDGFPTGLPDIVTTNIATPAYITTTGMTNLSRIDQYTINLDGGFTAIVYHLHPTIDNNRLVIFHQGHSDNLDLNGGQATMEYFIERGYSILAFHMPLYGPNTGPDIVPHNGMQALETPSFNPMEVFFEPIAVALNYTDQNYDYQDISMTGISGGGWIIPLYAGIDTRIKKSFATAGSLPLFLEESPCGTESNADYEQGQQGGKPANLYENIASYLDFYILSSVGPDRKHIQILNQFDTCCFAGLRFNIYESTVANEVASLSGGVFDVALDTTHTDHLISSWQRTNVMLPELRQTVRKVESGGSTSVIEFANPTDTYTLVLDGKPTANVVISLMSSDTINGVTVSPASLTFTRANWDTPRTVTITAVGDALSEMSHTATISHTVSSSDEHYNGITMNDITVNISEDIIAPTFSNVSAEGGTTVTITWTTNEAASTQIDYGLTSSYGTTTTETDTSPRVTSHSVSLTGITACTTYHYRVKSTDASSNTAIGLDNTFTTTGCARGGASPIGSATVNAPLLDDTLTPSAPTTTSSVGDRNSTLPKNKPDTTVINITEGTDEQVEVINQQTEQTTDTIPAPESSSQQEHNSIIRSLSNLGRAIFNFFQSAISAIVKIFDRTPELPDHLKDHMYRKVTVRLLDDQQQPLIGATVTLFSEPQTKITDETGTAVFENIKAGAHRMKITYNDYKTSQKLLLDRDTDELQITTQANFQDGIPTLWLIASVIATLSLYLVGKICRL